MDVVGVGPVPGVYVGEIVRSDCDALGVYCFVPINKEAILLARTASLYC